MNIERVSVLIEKCITKTQKYNCIAIKFDQHSDELRRIKLVDKEKRSLRYGIPQKV